MKKLLVAVAASFAFAASASAADMPGVAKAPPLVAPAFSWTGCYFGAYVGGAWASRDIDVVDVNGYDQALRPVGGWSYPLESSVLGGGTVGCNLQFGGSPWVVGLEGEGGYLHMPGTASDPLATSVVASAKIGDWYGMVTGRLGYAIDRALFYVKGGATFVETQVSIADPAPGIRGLGLLAASASNTDAAWTAGGGIEWAFDPNWSLKAEYMFIGLNRTLTDCATIGGTGYCWNNLGGGNGISTGKVGINYRFGAPAPVAARY